MSFLPVTPDEITNPDFILVTGDAYVDHPSFGAAIIGRLLESHGYSVAVLAQPDWRDKDNFKIFGEPRLGFLVTSGNIDSMVNHYTSAKKRRGNDMYSPEGRTGLRPDRASIVYSQKIREAYKDVPIILGGLEASLRRMAHYDYWDDKVRRSVLMDSGSDLVVYGMGEHQIVEIAEALNSGLPIGEITFINGTVYKTKDLDRVYDYIMLPSFKEAASSKEIFAKSFYIQYQNAEHFTAKPLVENYGGVYAVQNIPAAPLTTNEMDRIYGLKYMRTFHPMYKNVPAIEEVRFSILSGRGCFGACNFCAIGFHQGRLVQARSHMSIINEAVKLTYESGFKGYIHDVGGPTANFRRPACDNTLCVGRKCLFPSPCKNLIIDHKDYLELLRVLRSLPEVKKVFVRSGLRYDYLIYDKDDTFFRELCEHHISGQLKVAPEHVSPKVLSKMGKPSRDVYEKFVDRFYKINGELDKKQFLVPYLMSGHPGSGLKEAVELAEYLRDIGHAPEQVQDFYPTPGTLSTAMYYTGLDPRTMEKVYVPKKSKEKAMQRALMQYRLPQNYELVAEALKTVSREDLISFDKKGLIRPRRATGGTASRRLVNFGRNKNVYKFKKRKNGGNGK